REIEHVRRLYDAEVAGTDRAIGTLLEGLDELGLSGDLIVALTSDHGESLGEHSYWFGHGEYLYDETLVVPLLLRAPGLLRAGARLSGLTRLEDVAPTLLELLGVDPPDGIDGRSFASSIRAGGTNGVPEDVAELQLTDHVLVRDENPRRSVPGREGRWRAVREQRWKLIQVPLGNGETAEELYDLAEDPEETANLLASRPDEAERLRFQLQRLAQSLGSRTTEQEDPSTQEHLDTLRGLGYAR
ncbi:MAG: sulfatase-like hydrolase/transferase, partial [Acidobacteriota bacterium]|nr:sulfatase-like hydrolase/transferase [Acidobacteriota bacterium]